MKHKKWKEARENMEQEQKTIDRLMGEIQQEKAVQVEKKK